MNLANTKDSHQVGLALVSSETCGKLAPPARGGESSHPPTQPCEGWPEPSADSGGNQGLYAQVSLSYSVKRAMGKWWWGGAGR